MFLFVWLNYFHIQTNLNNIIIKNERLEKACYESINMYILMIFNNYTINEMTDIIDIEKKNEQQNDENPTNNIFNYFYQNLYLIFDSIKDKNNLNNLYINEQLTDFNCSKIYNTIKFDVLEEIYKLFPDKDIKQKLINICIISYITESKDVKTIFERHFQFIKNGMLTLTDFSYEGLNKNLDSTLIGRITFFFLTTSIYIIEMVLTIPTENYIRLLNDMVNNKFLLMQISFIAFEIYLILVIIFFYFNKINKF